MGENLSDTEYRDENERMDEYDTSDDFINDEYVDDQYSGDSEASLEPVVRTKKRDRKLQGNSDTDSVDVYASTCKQDRKRARLVSDDDNEPSIAKRVTFSNEQGSSDSACKYKKRKSKDRSRDRKSTESWSHDKKAPTRDTMAKEGASSADYKNIKNPAESPKKHKSKRTNVNASPKSWASAQMREEYAHRKRTFSSSKSPTAITSPDKYCIVSLLKLASSKGSFSPNVAASSPDETRASPSTKSLSPRSVISICPDLSDFDACDSDESTSSLIREFNVSM